MEIECENQEGVPNNLREQLALALRSIQWSYGIFWSMSSNSPGVLKWIDGYYNGEIKTRKTVQTAEVNADQMGLQRSEQLRELYESLLVGEVSPQARRPSAALSPEDLTEAEWYYLVCMSFTFNIGQGLPGRALSKNQTMWLCNAHQAESKTFSRSLLAKSASIQTVVCFPCLGGIIELGATELVSEDLNLIERVKASLLELPYSTAAKITSYVADNARNEQDINAATFDHDMPKTDLNPLIEGEEELICSPNNSSNGFGANQQAEDPNMVEGIIREASQVQSWYLVDDETSNHIHHSVNSSDSISQSYATPQNVSHLSNGEKLQNDAQHDIQESNQKEMSSFNPRGEDVHYQGVLSNLLKSSHQLILGPYFRNGRRESSFMNWKKEASLSFQAPQRGTPQRLLKKVLFEVAKLHNGYLVEPGKDNCRSESIQQQEVNGIDKNLAFSERRQREKINERFMMLSLMVPTKSKADKLSILDDTIEHLKQLERRVQELESCKELVPKTGTPHDAVERTSDNYGPTKRCNSKKSQLKKRRIRDIDDTEPGNGNERSLLRDCSTEDVAVSIVDKDIWIEMRLPWRDGLLLEIMEIMSNLHLDSDTIQSTNSEGILSVTIKSKLKGSKVSSAGMIRQALQSLINKR